MVYRCESSKKTTWKVCCSYKNFYGVRKWTTKRGFKKKSDAQEWEAHFKAKMKGALSMNMENFSELYLNNAKSRMKPTSYRRMESTIRNWILPYFGKIPIYSITNKNVLDWQNVIINHTKPDGGKLSEQTKSNIHATLVAIFSHAKKYYNLASNPASIVGGIGSHAKSCADFWTKDEYMKFREAIKDDFDLLVVFDILYFLGLRIGELLALTKDDIDFNTGYIKIDKSYQRIKKKDVISSPKTSKSNRKVGIPDFLLEELKEYLSNSFKGTDKDRLFQYTRDTYRLAIIKYSKIAGVKKIRIHDLRHSHVSLLISMGYSALAIADRVGHESIYITYHYAHLFPDEQSRMANSLNNLIK